MTSPHIVRRDVRRHAHRNARGSVDQQVREVAGQHRGFLKAVVVVVAEIHGFLFDVRQHFQGNLAHAGFGITVSRRGIAVYRSEVAVAVHQHVPHGKILRQTDQRVVYGSVAVRVVLPQHRAHGIRTFAVRLIGVQVLFKHRIQDPAVYRLEAVAHVRQCPRYDDRHGIGQKGFLHFLLDIYIPNAPAAFARPVRHGVQRPFLLFKLLHLLHPFLHIFFFYPAPQVGLQAFLFLFGEGSFRNKVDFPNPNVK